MNSWAVLALDPGDEHTGVAVMDSTEMQVSTETQENHGTPALLGYLVLSFVADLAPTYEHTTVVCEDFKLYPGKAAEQSWSQMLTARGIGAAEFALSLASRKIILQGADIKKPTERQLVGRGIDLVGANRHEKDAELHLWHYVLKSGLWLAAAANNN